MNLLLIKSTFGKETCQLIQSKMEQDISILMYGEESDQWFIKKKNHDRFYKCINTNPQSLIRQIGSSNIGINWSMQVGANLNRNQSLDKAKNKLLCRKLLQEANIPVPKTWFNLNDVPLQPFIARPKYHYGGNSFVVINDFSGAYNFYRQFTPDWYFSAIFPKVKEYRVHCAYGKVLAINEKPLVEGEIRANHTVNEEAWRYIPWEEYKVRICKPCLQAMDVIGLDYGAVDIMEAADKTVAICEINTSPALSDYTSSKYAQFFDWYLRQPNRQKWNHSEWTSGQSYAWKNEQLRG